MRPDSCSVNPKSFFQHVFVLQALFIVLVLAPVTLAAEGTGDAVIDGVVDLLAAELSDAVIVQWLATTEEEPRTPSAQDVIALRQAGASDEVIVALLEKARGELEVSGHSAPQSSAPGRATNSPPAAPAIPGDMATPSPDGRPAPGGPLPGRSVSGQTASGETASGQTDADRAAPQRSRSRDDFSLDSRPFDRPSSSEAARLVPEGRGAISARFSLSNVPYWLEGEDPWSLFLYLNGEPVTFISEGSVFSGKPLRFTKLLKPGPQRLMLFRERHDDDENEHLTKVMPQRIEFNLEPGGSAEIEIAFKQTVISQNNPVSYRVAQNGRLVVESGELGGDPDQWQWLCDDLERTLDGKQDRRLESCVRWRDLWHGYSGEPTRSQVLQAFSNFDYRPVPLDQNLH